MRYDGHKRWLLPLTALTLMLSLPAVGQEMDPEGGQDCLQLVPGAVSVTSTPVRLRLRVVLDGVDMAVASQAVADAQGAYNALGVQLEPSYERASFSSRDGAALISEAKRRYGGIRPAGSDAVYVITAKDLTNGETDTSLAGLADCIGGVAFADRAFAVGEALADAPLELGLITLQNQGAAKVLGHEVGHLLGAHHHYANCLEALPAGDNLCTLMFNDISLETLRFSTVNSLVIRGAAQAFLPSAAGTGSGGSGGSGGSADQGSGGGSLPVALLLALAAAAAMRAGLRRSV